MGNNALPMMSFVDSITTCFNKYVSFEGRARRSEYWWFWGLTYIVIIFIINLVIWQFHEHSKLESEYLGVLLDLDKQDAIRAQISAVDSTFTTWIFVLGILMLLLLLPSLAVLTRRLHDTGRSGWIIVLNFIPVVNIVTIIMTFIYTVMDSKPEDNKYGPSPKYISEDA